MIVFIELRILSRKLALGTAIRYGNFDHLLLRLLEFCSLPLTGFFWCNGKSGTGNFKQLLNSSQDCSVLLRFSGFFQITVQ